MKLIIKEDRVKKFKDLILWAPQSEELGRGQLPVSLSEDQDSHLQSYIKQSATIYFFNFSHTIFLRGSKGSNIDEIYIFFF